MQPNIKQNRIQSKINVTCLGWSGWFWCKKITHLCFVSTPGRQPTNMWTGKNYAKSGKITVWITRTYNRDSQKIRSNHSSRGRTHSTDPRKRRAAEQDPCRWTQRVEWYKGKVRSAQVRQWRKPQSFQQSRIFPLIHILYWLILIFLGNLQNL